MISDIPVFEILVDERGRPKFAHPPQGYAYLRRFAGQLIVGQFYEFRAKRSDRQNRAFHALITPWALTRGWAIETMKQWLLSRAFGWLEIVDPETGEVIKVLAEPHTSKLNVTKFCTLIETVLELAAYDGLVLQAPDEYRRAKEAAAKQAERAARKADAA